MKQNKLTAEEIYNYSTIRNVTVVFGNIFSNLKVRRYNSDGSISNKHTIVPLIYSAKDQYAFWVEQQMRLPTGNIEINNKFPRISFEMTGFKPAPEKGINSNVPMIRNRIECGKTIRSRAPISYSFDFVVTIWAKQMDVSIQILDQILPIFAPEISIKIKESKVMQIYNDVTVILQSISKNDNYQSGFDENRLISWDLSFEVYANIIPPGDEISVINKIQIDTDTMISKYIEGETPSYIDSMYGIELREDNA